MNLPAIDLVFDLRYLRCALSAAEHGSIRRAAQTLDLSQSTVTRRIQLLERRLGFQLFIRDRRGVKPTIAGAGFLKDSISGAQYLDRAVRLGAAVHRGEQGELRVGVLISPISDLLQGALRKFREQQPSVRIFLKEATSLELLHALSMGELDVAFITGNINLDGYNKQFLWDETVFAAFPVDHILASKDALFWSDLQQETFLISRSGPKLQDYLAKKLGSQGVNVRADVHDVSRTGLFDLVVAGFGIALVTSPSAPANIPGVVFRRIVGESGVMPTRVAWIEAPTGVRRLIEAAEIIARDTRREAEHSPLAKTEERPAEAHPSDAQ